MSLALVADPAPDATLMVVPWIDPVVDSVGYDVRSTYVELFWLNVLGPTATWVVRRLVGGFDRYPLGYEIDLVEMASELGLGFGVGTSNAFQKSLNRCSMFGVTQPSGGALAVRRRLPPLATRHLARMPEGLRAMHSDWLVAHARLDLADLDRARILATAMAATGDEPGVIERQLLGLGVPPLAAAEACVVL